MTLDVWCADHNLLVSSRSAKETTRVILAVSDFTRIFVGRPNTKTRSVADLHMRALWRLRQGVGTSSAGAAPNVGIIMNAHVEYLVQTREYETLLYNWKQRMCRSLSFVEDVICFVHKFFHFNEIHTYLRWYDMTTPLTVMNSTEVQRIRDRRTEVMQDMSWRRCSSLL